MAAAAAVALALPSTAGAHLRSGTVAVDYRPRVTHTPAGPVRVGVYVSDRALHVGVKRGHGAVVYGYLGEPFVRVGDGGVSVDTASPTAGWVLRSHRLSVVWHDVLASRPRWRVPVAVDGRRETSPAKRRDCRGRRCGRGSSCSRRSLRPLRFCAAQ